MGKTTFFDAVDWCLFGNSSRFGQQSELRRNLYSDVDPFVELVLVLDEHSVRISRTERGAKIDGADVSDKLLAERLIVDADVFPPFLRDLAKQVRAVTYLAQEQIRDFVGATTDDERALLLSALLGVQNAAVVSSSIKRVRDNFVARERELDSRIDRLRLEEANFASTDPLDLALESDVTEFLAAFREHHPSTGDFTVASARSVLQKDVEDGERARATLESVLVAHSETARALEQIRDEIAESQERRAQLERQSLDAQEKAKQGTQAVESTLKQLQTVTVARAAAAQRTGALVSAAEEQKRASQLNKQLSDNRARAINIDRQVAALTREAASLAESINLAEQMVLQEAAEDQKRAQRAALSSQRRQIQDDLQSHEARRVATTENLERLERETARLSKDASDAAATKRKASEDYDRAANEAKRAARIADLGKALLSIVRPGESRCPLCDAEHETPEQLREHIVRKTSGYTVDQRLQELGTTLRVADAASNSAADRLSLQQRDVDGVRGLLKSITQQLALLRDQDDICVSGLRKLGSPLVLKSETDVARTRVLALNARQREIGAEVTKLTEEREFLEASIKRDSASLSGFSSVVAVEVTPEAISTSEAEVGRLQEQERDISRTLRSLREEQSRLDAAAASLRTELAALDGRLAGENDRQQRAAREFELQCAAIGVRAPIDMGLVGAELDRRVTAARGQTVAARELVSRAMELERRLDVNRRVSNANAQRHAFQEAMRARQVLLRATSRFDTIARGLETRSTKEAQAAGAQHLQAIRRCVRDLSPYRHLSDVDIKFGTGELLVSDQWLDRRQVRPYDYSSTGQANMLALSVFFGISLHQRFSRPRFLMLDEPVQNLDDLNFLAFLTLVKRVALSRQVIVSTADSNLAEILRRQLRSWAAPERSWVEYHWHDFEPKQGPSVSCRRHTHVAAA